MQCKTTWWLDNVVLQGGKQGPVGQGASPTKCHTVQVPPHAVNLCTPRWARKPSTSMRNGSQGLASSIAQNASFGYDLDDHNFIRVCKRDKTIYRPTAIETASKLLLACLVVHHPHITVRSGSGLCNKKPFSDFHEYLHLLADVICPDRFL